MKQKLSKKQLYSILSKVFFGIAAGCMVTLIILFYQQDKVKNAVEQADRSSTHQSYTLDYNPIDFEELKEINPYIYSWIKIPGMDISYPIIQHPTVNDYYLRKDIYGNYSTAGTLYTQQSYNSTDYEDPCTIIYGHQMNDGSMFGRLQDYTMGLDLSTDDDENYFEIYTEGEKLIYRIVATGSFSTAHVLYYYNFSNAKSRNTFLKELTTHVLKTHNENKEEYPEDGDKLVILSTCYKRNFAYRYLVVGKLMATHYYDN